MNAAPQRLCDEWDYDGLWSWDFGATNAYCILNDINSHNDDNVYCVNTSSNVLIPRDLFVNQSLQGASLLGEEENSSLGALRFS